MAEALADIGLEMMLELEKGLWIDDSLLSASGGLTATYLQEVNASAASHKHPATMGFEGGLL